MATIASWKRKLSHFQRVAVDANIFIYSFEEHPQYQALCGEIFERVSTNTLHLLTSVLTLSEVLVQPLRHHDGEVVLMYENLFSTLPSFSLLPITMDIARTAARLRAHYNIVLPDAFHIATALEGKAEAFITNDKKLQRVKELPVLCLKDFI